MSSNLLSVSVEEIISRIFSRLKAIDISYADDFLVWMPEAMDELKTQYILKPDFQDIKIEDNAGKLPCDLYDIVGVLYKGMRLRYGANNIDPRVSPQSYVNKVKNQTIFKTDVTSEAHTNQANYNLIRGLDLVGTVKETQSDYYILSLNNIQTSFEEGTIRIFYMKRPVDDQGYALIPDNENYKKSLEWYCYAQMVFSGFVMPVAKMDYDYCNDKFDTYQVRAVNEINYPTTDKWERLLRSSVSLIPPQSYYNNFFVGSENPNYVNR